jgi:hypothetical protein
MNDDEIPTSQSKSRHSVQPGGNGAHLFGEKTRALIVSPASRE